MTTLKMPEPSHANLDGLPLYTAEALRDVLEQAAKLCDAKFDKRSAGGFPREASTARNLATEIRAMKEQIK